MSGALRNREYRTRQKAGRSVFAIECDEIALADALIVAGLRRGDRIMSAHSNHICKCPLSGVKRT
jgi:hypothetical protein